jgi:acyl-CoA thioesterase I
LFAGEADKKNYLAPVAEILGKQWPKNRAVHIVCHGHSVPAGYFKTPTVDTFNAYPHLFHVAIKQRYPFAVVNVIVTAIGGENSVSGAARFEKDALIHNPDILLIDYALNDRRVPLEKSKAAWSSMIEKALAKNIKVILLTPTGDTSAKLDDPNDPLNKNAEQIRALAKQYGVGLADSLDAINQHIQKGGKLDDLMSQINHPNRKGHDLVVERLMEWVP